MKAQPRILLFLPYHNQRYGFSELLAEWGYSPEPVSSIAAVLEDLRASNFDLLILDLCDSYVERHIDDLLRLPHKILFLACDRHVHGLLLPTGFKDVLEKPVDVEAFRSRVQELLGQIVP